MGKGLELSLFSEDCDKNSWSISVPKSIPGEKSHRCCDITMCCQLVLLSKHDPSTSNLSMWAENSQGEYISP